jgi:hypothetical protein
MLFVVGNPTRGLAQKARSVVHPAPGSQVITVTVTETHRNKHGQETEILIDQAAGFPNDTCDVITTFDVVRMYEERQTWRNIRQRIDIVINGTPYPAKLRDVGYYPLGLNLACIDFDSPSLREELNIPVLPLDQGSRHPSSLSYDDKEIAKSNPGTPFLNQQGEISSVLIPSFSGELQFASADDIRAFLKVAADVAPWPTLNLRPLSST